MNGFDFIDFWAVDFDWSPGKPFCHHWQDYRTRMDRSLNTVSEAGYKYPKPGLNSWRLSNSSVLAIKTVKTSSARSPASAPVTFSKASD